MQKPSGSSFPQLFGILWMDVKYWISLELDFNASLTAINLAKAACKRLKIPFSISSCKTMIHNAYILERFICVSGITPNKQVIDKLFKELILFSARAAQAWLIFNELVTIPKTDEKHFSKIQNQPNIRFSKSVLYICTGNR